MKCTSCGSRGAIRRDDIIALCPNCLRREALTNEAETHLKELIKDTLKEWAEFYNRVGMTEKGEIKSAAQSVFDDLLEVL